ncbi:hypothetical protein KSE_14110 [Kitasatospora setae KM-6054]|uniref:Uncharacterized protein n=1 Tax=Kitasatospora setae (strain ATCC 33774 / DSM 43861 / JCM 3304 / KCC A-0304 / NBRC 14216 / KM-6054) TaxID=452652 RepID=E4N7Q8_KITSK|nr:hypothetical protein KSE_14110 [Kitasatospora setae KM-6054]
MYIRRREVTVSQYAQNQHAGGQVPPRPAASPQPAGPPPTGPQPPYHGGTQAIPTLGPTAPRTDRPTVPLKAVGPVAPGGTGHFLLPAGGTVQLPAAPPPQPAFPAPQPGFPGPPPLGPLAVLLIGPAGAGKTTVARYWAERRPTPTAHISLDDVREWVQAGFANPQSGWNTASEAQYRLARRTCGFACRNYLANGISCIIDDAVFPDRPAIGLGGWKRHIGPGMIPVVLLPGLDRVLTRNAERSGNRRLSDDEVARIHGRMAGWRTSGLPIIDNSNLSVPETAAALDRAVMSRLQAR